MAVESSQGSRGDVLVLGAGFSRALSKHMPLTDLLGTRSLERAGLAHDPTAPSGGFSDGNFETWLSRLADEQPYLNAQDNLRNKASFLQLSQAIADELGECVQRTLAEPWPSWLPPLLNVAHERRATLVTFNYDTLVECAVAAKAVNDRIVPEEFAWYDVINDVPPPPPGSSRMRFPRVPTFRLLKMHGSLNWYWMSGDGTGVSLARRDLPGTYGAPAPYVEEDRERELPGRVPFVVPPAAAKSSFYSMPLLHEIWQQAANAVREAKRVVLIGYSLPPTDLTFGSLLATTLPSTSAPVVVVDRCPNAVEERLSQLGVAQHRIKLIGGDEPVDEFARLWLAEQSTTLLEFLASTPYLDDPVLVTWDRGLAAPVHQVIVDGSEVVLGLGALTAEFASVAVRPGSPERLPSLREVLAAAPRGSSLVVRPDAMPPQTLCGWRRMQSGWGHSDGFNVLTPAGDRSGIEGFNYA